MTDLATDTASTNHADVLTAENTRLALAVTELHGQLDTARQDLANERAYHQNWRDALVSSAHEWARDNDLCSRFDDFMDEHGLPRRDVTLRVTFTLTVPHDDSENRSAIFDALNTEAMTWEEDDD